MGIALTVYRPDLTSFREQLVSIREQRYTNWFCVLTADSPLSEISSSDELADLVADPRFHWHQNERRLGFKANFAHAIQLAVADGAELIACSDQDDVWYPDKLSLLVEEIRDKPPLSLVHCDMDVLQSGVKLPLSGWEMERRGVRNAGPSSLLLRNVVTGAAMLMDAELPRRYPIVPDEIEFHDYWYTLVASFHGGVHPLAKRLYAYRQHDENVLGVMPYRGFLDGQPWTTMLERRREALKYWRDTQKLATRARDVGLPLSRFQEIAFIRPGDHGLMLFGLALVSLHDPVAARSSLALGLGKLMDGLERSDRSS